jgi:hypothetical protein
LGSEINDYGDHETIRIKLPDRPLPPADPFLNCSTGVIYNYGTIICQVLNNYGKIVNFGRIYAQIINNFGVFINGRRGDSAERGTVHELEPGTVEISRVKGRLLPPLPTKEPRLPPLPTKAGPLPPLPTKAGLLSPLPHPASLTELTNGSQTLRNELEEH